MRAFLTGCTGSLGSTVVKKLLADGHEIVGISRDEQKQRLLPKHENLKTVLADVRDRDRMIELSRGCDVIFHFAALKCVDTLEFNAWEATKTNVWGTQNILDAQRLNEIPKLIFTSTDKACYPVNAYGRSKALAESLVLSNPENVVCRYGNVIASRASVIPMFVKSLSVSRSVDITSSDMTRFFLTLDQASDFVISQVSNRGLNLPELKACRIIDLAWTVADIMGIRGYEQNLIGIRPGEKIHECLRMFNEGGDIYSDDDDIQMSMAELKDLVKNEVVKLWI